MISEEALNHAAEESRALFVECLEFDYFPSSQHKFTPGFEKKIKKLYHKANHPNLYTVLSRVASVLLAICIASGVWLSVDVEARAAAIQWMREAYEDSVLYRYFNTQESGPLPEYEITALPNGYTQTNTIVDETSCIQIFESSSDGFLFVYNLVSANTETNLFFFDDYTYECVAVGEFKADYYVSDDPSVTNELLWVDEKMGIQFQISSFLGQNEVLAMANSIALKNQTKNS